MNEAVERLIRCVKCGDPKPASAYYVNRSGSTEYLKRACKRCLNDARAENMRKAKARAAGLPPERAPEPEPPPEPAPEFRSQCGLCKKTAAGSEWRLVKQAMEDHLTGHGLTAGRAAVLAERWTDRA